MWMGGIGKYGYQRSIKSSKSTFGVNSDNDIDVKAWIDGPNINLITIYIDIVIKALRAGAERFSHNPHQHRSLISTANLVDKVIIIDSITTISASITITRPKPAYGQQGLAGSWGQDTDQASTFCGVLNVSLRICNAQLGFKPTWNHKCR